ncbi:unnamed protein product [Lota lota]
MMLSLCHGRHRGPRALLKQIYYPNSPRLAPPHPVLLIRSLGSAPSTRSTTEQRLLSVHLDSRFVWHSCETALGDAVVSPGSRRLERPVCAGDVERSIRAVVSSWEHFLWTADSGLDDDPRPGTSGEPPSPDRWPPAIDRGRQGLSPADPRAPGAARTDLLPCSPNFPPPSMDAWGWSS